MIVDAGEIARNRIKEGTMSNVQGATLFEKTFKKVIDNILNQQAKLLDLSVQQATRKLIQRQQKTDAIHKIKWKRKQDTKGGDGLLPKNAKIIFFNGRHDPSDEILQKHYPWIEEHWL